MRLTPLLAVATCAILAAPGAAEDRVRVRLDASQAHAALAVMDAVTEQGGATRAHWRTLETSRPYQRLKAREASLNVGFTDAEFRAFLTSPEQTARRVALAETLKRWETIDVAAQAQRAFDYLPPGARLEGEVYYLIKPRTNSFVWDLANAPGVFLYLDPAATAAQTRNTIAHELHHVGMARNCPAAEVGPDGPAQLRRWSGGFAEGLAMLAAAGGADRHPHADSAPEVRATWDRGVARFERDLREQDAFFARVVRGEAGDAAAVAEVMRGYYGEQGPWYTVGWRMAETLERVGGRPAVVEAFCRPGGVFSAYNDAARALNAAGEALPLWSPEVVAAMAR